MAEVKLNLPIPEGWEATGEWRRVQQGEEYLSSLGVQRWSDWNPTQGYFPILRKKAPEPRAGQVWRGASEDFLLLAPKTNPNSPKNYWECWSLTKSRFVDGVLMWPGYREFLANSVSDYFSQKRCGAETEG